MLIMVFETFFITSLTNIIEIMLSIEYKRYKLKQNNETKLKVSGLKSNHATIYAIIILRTSSISRIMNASLEYSGSIKKWKPFTCMSIKSIEVLHLGIQRSSLLQLFTSQVSISLQGIMLQLSINPPPVVGLSKLKSHNKNESNLSKKPEWYINIHVCVLPASPFVTTRVIRGLLQ